MPRTTALTRAIAALAIVAAVATLAGTAAARGNPHGESCKRRCLATTTTTTTTAPAPTTTTVAVTTTTTVTVPTPEPTPTIGDPSDTVITDPSAVGALLPLLRTRLIQRGALTGVLYLDSATSRPSVWFRDHETRATSILELPSDSRQGWGYAAAAMTSATDLWVAGGSGPITVRHYVLDGGPLPHTAVLAESREFGSSDSRPGDFIGLADGGLVLAWHQQGASGPQGQYIAHRSATGSWSELPALTFMPTQSSDQVLAQHPSDHSIWLFSNPDMWGAIGAARLIPGPSSLIVDWTNGMYISELAYGLNAPDPENPDLAVTADPSTGTLALAYQTRDRKYVGVSPNLQVVSRVAIARIPAAGAPSFLVAPVWAERVADIGVITSEGRTDITYRGVDATSGALRGIHLARYRDGTWGTPVPLADGTLTSVAYSSLRTELVGLASDWRIHVLSP